MKSVTNFLLALRPKSSLLDKMGALSRDHAKGHRAQLAEASAGCCAAEKYRTELGMLFCFNFVNISLF